MYTLLVKGSFEAAHFIPGHPGKCANLHGHSYNVEAEFTGDRLNELGMVLDFGDLSDALRDVLPDHRFLNDLMDVPTTAENISAWLFGQLSERGLPIRALTVWETSRYGCRYEPD